MNNLIDEKPPENITKPNKTKKIGFFSAIFLVFGVTTGTGIFLRSKAVLEKSAFNIVWAIIVWLIAGFAVIVMALSLIEVASGCDDNLSIIGWTKKFSTLHIYKATKFLMTYLYLPFTYMVMPTYVILQFQNGLSAFTNNANVINFNNSKGAPWFYFLIALAISVWALFTGGLSSKIGNIQNWILTIIKFIPMIAVTFIGFVFIGKYGINYQPLTKQNLFNKESLSMFGVSPFFGVFGAIGGIFFAFDGFYTTAGLQTEMKEPKKTPLVLALGLLFITIVYIVIATSMTLGASALPLGNKKEIGGFYEFGAQLKANGFGWIFGIVNICISLGILGIISGFSIWTARWIENLIEEGEILIPARAYKYMKNAKRPLVGCWYVLLLSLPYMLFATIIGAYVYKNESLPNIYGYGINNLIGFCDLMGNWMAVFSFSFIAFSIIGVIKNRKTNKVATIKYKHTIWSGYIAIIMIFIVLILTIIEPFTSIGIATNRYYQTLNNSTLTILEKQTQLQNIKSTLISHILTSILFILYTTISFTSMYIEKLVALKRHKKLTKLINSETDENKKELLLISNELNNKLLMTYNVF